MKRNITVVIRSAGERTTELCHYILCTQLPEKNIFIVKESPSTEGTRAVYKRGLKEGRKWTLFVDADQLLYSDSIEFLYNLAEAQDTLPFGVKGMVKDKLFLDLRGMGCGPILYYTEAFEYAINYIPDPYKKIRPDSWIINNMKKNHGYGWVREKKYVALHDYEQFYYDIYRKMYINASKMTSKCKKMFDRWKKLSKIDKDYIVCMQGYRAGTSNNEPLAIDYSKDFGYKPLFAEKEPITNFKKKIEELCLK